MMNNSRNVEETWTNRRINEFDGRFHSIPIRSYRYELELEQVYEAIMNDN